MIKLLLVEDDELDRELIRRTIQGSRLDAKLFEADSLDQACHLLTQDAFDCILSDLSLPDGDGLELISRSATAAFVVLTGSSDARAKVALDQGAQEYLLKDRIESYWLARAIEHAIERKRLQLFVQQAEHHQRLASLGQLAASVAHEINNPLAFVRANLSYIQQHTAQSLNLPESLLSELPELLKDSLIGLERIAHIVQQMQTFATRQDDHRDTTTLDLRDVADWAIALTRTRIQHQARFIWARPSPMPLIIGRSGQLAQVLTNLLLNAAQATEHLKDPIIQLTLSSDEHGIYFWVDDSGPGLSPELKLRVLDPFFTTKAIGKGTGLGLSISQEIVQAHHGRLSLQDSALGGLRVELFIPFDTGLTLNATTPASLPSPDPTSLNVLVIDDEPALLRAYTRMLKPNHVIAHDGPAALEWLNDLDHASTLDVIVCDMMMPELNGMQLYEQVVQQHPHLASRFIFSSGGVFQQEIIQFLEAHPELPLIEKPMKKATLLSLISKVVETAQG